MSGCMCEPHASGSNRCVFCNAEQRNSTVPRYAPAPVAPPSRWARASRADLEAHFEAYMLGNFVTARAEADQLRRAWALYELQDMDHPTCKPDEWVAMLQRLGLPESIAALIRAGAGCPIGECDACGKRAPLVNGMNYDGLCVCAPGWPCNPNPKEIA